MLNILLMIILLIIIFIFIILLFGIRLTAKWMKIDSDYDGCVEILILKKLKVYSFSLKPDDDEEEEDEDEDYSKRDVRKIYELARPCFKYFKRFLHDFLNSVSINKFENHLIIGFSNFAKTGEYIGYIWAVSSVLSGLIPNAYLKSEPSFAGEVLNVKGSLNIDINLLKLILPVIRLISKKEVIRLIKGVINE